MALLAIIAFLQSVALIFQAKYLTKTVTNLFNGEKLSLQLLPISLFFLFYVVRQSLILFREKRITAFASKAG